MLVLPQQAAKAVIVQAGLVLVLRPTGGSRYELPGGRLQVGETLEMALVREVREETGLTIEPGASFAVRTWQRETPDGIFEVTASFFVCSAPQADIVLSVDHDDAQWVDPRTTSLVLQPTVQEVLALFVAQA